MKLYFDKFFYFCYQVDFTLSAEEELPSLVSKIALHAATCNLCPLTGTLCVNHLPENASSFRQKNSGKEVIPFKCFSILPEVM